MHFTSETKIKDYGSSFSIEAHIIWLQISKDNTIVVKVFHSFGYTQSNIFNSFNQLAVGYRITKFASFFDSTSFQPLCQCILENIYDQEIPSTLDVRRFEFSTINSMQVDNVFVVQS